MFRLEVRTKALPWRWSMSSRAPSSRKLENLGPPGVLSRCRPSGDSSSFHCATSSSSPSWKRSTKSSPSERVCARSIWAVTLPTSTAEIVCCAARVST